MPKHEFQKGNTFGKEGRPPNSGKIQLFNTYMAEKGYQKIIDIADGKDYKVGTINGKFTEIGPSQELQLDALKFITSYVIGKPSEHIDVTSGSRSLFEFLQGEFHPNGAEALAPGRIPGRRTSAGDNQ